MSRSQDTPSRRHDPHAGIVACPDGVAVALAANDLEVAHTLTDGNCGYHAFGISYLAAAKVYPGVQALAAHKKLAKFKEPHALAGFLRTSAAEWLRAHAADIIIDNNLTVAQMCLYSSGRNETFPEYLKRVATNGEWADASIIHALSCLHRVDCAIWQDAMDQCLLGISLMSAEDNHDRPLIHLAMRNDVHWWGVVPRPPEQRRPRETEEVFEQIVCACQGAGYGEVLSGSP